MLLEQKNQTSSSLVPNNLVLELDRGTLVPSPQGLSFQHWFFGLNQIDFPSKTGAV
jgi:hypothetical protein